MAYLNSKIIDLYKQGLTYEEIGRKFGVTRERIRQLIQDGIYFEVIKEKTLSEGQKSIEELDLSKRTFNSLVSAGILSIEKLITCNEDDIIKLPSLGNKGINEIERELNKQGFKLSQKEKNESFLKPHISNKNRGKYTPVETLQFSERTLNALLKNNVESVEQLIQYPIHQLKKFKGLGGKSADEIYECLKSKNLSIRTPNIQKVEQSATMSSPPVVKKEEIREFFDEIKSAHKKSWTKRHKGDATKFLEMAKRYDSISKFLIDTKIHKIAVLREYYPQVFQVVQQNEIARKKRWHRLYTRCLDCGTTLIPHRGLGRCEKCYPKTECFKETQKRSRERNKGKWDKRLREYLKEYAQRPEVKERHRRRDDEKKYDGNREKAIERDDFRCAECGMSREESEKDFGQDLFVTRVDGNNQNNQLSNLKTVCKSCFNKFKFRKR